MEPAIVAQRGLLGKLAALVKRAVRKSVRWYIHPQLAALRDELTRARGELDELEKQQMRMQAFQLSQYLELSRRVKRLEAGQKIAAAPEGKAA